MVIVSVITAVVTLPVSCCCSCNATASLSAVILFAVVITASDVDVTGSMLKGPVELLHLV